ncbi:hypothetical protein M8J77_009184 [Diaphorina citri]|nr:hypothetical protein M8J77_009184 [Diaphorina citri]
MNFLLRVLVASTVVRLCSVIAGDYDFLSALFGLDYDSDSTESPDFGSVCIAAGSDMQGICTDPEWCEGMALGAGNCSESLCCCVGGGSCGANATSLVSYFTSPGYPRTFNGDPSQYLIAPVLAKLINLCFSECMFPSCLKQSLVHPVFKQKGDKSLASSYRPVSILPILRPLIFLLYINDLPVNLPDYARTTIFADDTTLFVEGSNQDDLIGRGEIVLAQAQVWFNANRLHLNQSKTQHIVISLSTANTFENPDSVDLLGFRIDPQLKWHAHIDKVAKKVSSRIFLLRRLQSQVSREALKNAYYGLVHSILTYGILLWGHSTSVPQLFILQKKAVRIVSGAQYLEHAKPLFIQLGILTLPSLFILQCLLHTKKNIAEFPNFEAAHSYDTRNKNNLVPFHHRVYAARNGTNYHGISFYNKLPLSIRDLPLPSFKRFIENYLKSKAFYSTEEFLLTDSDSICLPTDI